MLNDLLEAYKAITLNAHFDPEDGLRERQQKLTAISQYIDNCQWVKELADVCDSTNAGIAFYEIARSPLKGNRRYLDSLISYYFFSTVIRNNRLNKQAIEAYHYRGLLLFNLVLTNEAIVHRLFGLFKGHLNISSLEGNQQYEGINIKDVLQFLDYLLISDVLFCGNEYDYDSDYSALKRCALRNKSKYNCPESDIMMIGEILHKILFDIICNSLQINQ